MAPVYIFQDPNASSAYSQILRKINTHLLISTSEAVPWDMLVKVYRHRTDLRKTTGYDAIAEVLEKTLLDDLLDVNSNESSSTAEEKLLFLTSSSSTDSNNVCGLLSDGQMIRFSDTTQLATLEQILVPRKDPDFKFRQSVRIEGIQMPQLKVGLIYSGTDPSAVWVENMSSGLDLSCILPTTTTSPMPCNSMQEAIKALQTFRVL